MREDKVRMTQPQVAELCLHEQTSAVMEDLHLWQRPRPGGTKTVESLPCFQVGGDRRQEAVATVDLAWPRMALDQQHTQRISVRQRQSEGRPANAGPDHHHVE